MAQLPSLIDELELQLESLPWNDPEGQHRDSLAFAMGAEAQMGREICKEAIEILRGCIAPFEKGSANDRLHA